jgi:hypothetical protein
MAMFRKLRRGGKDTGVESKPSTRQNSIVIIQPEATQPNKLTFFDLPAEIRNQIYELVASDAILTLPLQKKETKTPPPVPGLLLASHQCRKEYLSLFLSTAPVIVEVKDFEFRHLIRVVGSLYNSEFKALRLNRNLCIHLRTQNCTRENLASLRKWLIKRGDSLDRLPWRYEVVHTPPSGRIGYFRLSRELKFYCERMGRMQIGLEDTLQWELQAVIAAFERKGEELDRGLQGVRPGIQEPRTLRGLSGGGVR